MSYEFATVSEQSLSRVKRATQWASRVLREKIWGKEQAARNERFGALASIALESLAGPKEWGGPRRVSVSVGPETRIALEDRPTLGLTINEEGPGLIDKKGPRLTIFKRVAFTTGEAALERTIYVPQYGGGVKVEVATGQLILGVDYEGNQTIGFRPDLEDRPSRLSADKLGDVEALLDLAQLQEEAPPTRVGLAAALGAQMNYAGQHIALQ